MIMCASETKVNKQNMSGKGGHMEGLVGKDRLGWGSACNLEWPGESQLKKVTFQ